MVWSARTRLTSDDLVVEPDSAAGRFKGRLEEVAAASVAAVERVAGPRAKGRGETTLLSRETMQIAEHARTGIEEGWSGD